MLHCWPVPFIPQLPTSLLDALYSLPCLTEITVCAVGRENGSTSVNTLVKTVLDSPDCALQKLEMKRQHPVDWECTKNSKVLCSPCIACFGDLVTYRLPPRLPTAVRARARDCCNTNARAQGPQRSSGTPNNFREPLLPPTPSRMREDFNNHQQPCTSKRWFGWLRSFGAKLESTHRLCLL